MRRNICIKSRGQKALSQGFSLGSYRSPKDTFQCLETFLAVTNQEGWEGLQSSRE